MKKYILSITYNFDGDYIAKSFNTEKDAIAELNRMLEEEVNVIKRESEYEPSVLRWSPDDITLVYAEGWDMDNIRIGNVSGHDYLMEDCAVYRVFEVEIK